MSGLAASGWPGRADGSGPRGRVVSASAPIALRHAEFVAVAQRAAAEEREAQIVASLDHPHIVPVYDYSEHEGQPYLVMKFIAGRTLKARRIESPNYSWRVRRSNNPPL